MKKLFTLLTSLLLAFSLTACAKEEVTKTPEVVDTIRVGVSWMMPEEDAASDEDCQAYMTSITKAGAEAVYMNQVTNLEEAKEELKKVDALIMAGGEDINPSLYGEEMNGSEEYYEERDTSDFWYLKAAIELDYPVLATCRGMQMLNTVQGGTLYQDLGNEYDTDILHRDPELINFTYHEVTIDDNNILADAMGGAGTYTVNSWHHQAIDKLGEGLKVVATAPDGIIEGVVLEDASYIYATQFHPEWHVVDGDLDCLNVFTSLIDAVKKNK